jgi:adenylate kinase family enzyme
VRVVVVGNSGSGKSTWARRVADAERLPLLELDMIVWEPNQVAVPRPADAVHADLAAFVARHPAWVIEGCDGDLAERVLPVATELVFLNPGLDACLANNRGRPYEPHKYASAEAQDRMLPNLLAWVESYYTRTDPRSYAFHRRLFDGHPGPKRELS